MLKTTIEKDYLWLWSSFVKLLSDDEKRSKHAALESKHENGINGIKNAPAVTAKMGGL
jgi:hypothetical protein